VYRDGNRPVIMEVASRTEFDPPCRPELAWARHSIRAVQFRWRPLRRGGRTGDRPAQALAAMCGMRGMGGQHLAESFDDLACVEGTRGVGDAETAWAKGRRTRRGLVLSCVNVPRPLPPKQDGWLQTCACDDVGGSHVYAASLGNRWSDRETI